MTTVNKTELIIKDRDSDEELINLIRNQGAIVYYEMNKEAAGLGRSINMLTFPINRFYMVCAIDSFQRGHVNYNVSEDGTKTLKAYALYIRLLDPFETNIISIGGEGKYLNRMLRRTIEYARNGSQILTLNILPIDRLVEYFSRFGFYTERTYFIREGNIITDRIKAFRLVNELL
jgi:hypothetical protein